MGKKSKNLWIDGAVGSQLRDTQGEMLSVEGADISDLERGAGRWNDNHGKGFFNSIGRVTFAKKILKEEDCSDERQKYYWEKIKAPYIYAKGYIYDDGDHPNAKAASAILRNIHKSDSPLKIKASVEGGVISRGIKDSSLLARTKIHSVALTFTPANNATLIEPLNLDKSYDEAADMALIKSVMHLAETNVPSFRHITRDASASKIVDNIDKIKDIATQLGIPHEEIPLLSKAHIIKGSVEQKIEDNIKKINDLMVALKQQEMSKALTAGYGGAGAPTGRVGGAVVQSESLDDGRSFKYATCDDCGKEQVYHRHQVKCRDCGKSFPLEKIYKLLSTK